MRSLRAVVLAALVLGTTAGSATAQVKQFGQSFRSPSGTPVLEKVNVGELSVYAASPVSFRLYAWDAGTEQPTGSPLWFSDVMGPTAEYLEFFPNLALAGDHMFAFLVEGAGGYMMTTSADFMEGTAFGCEDGDCTILQGSIRPKDINGFALTWGSTAVPEPLTLLLLGSGLAGLAGARRRRR